MLFLYTVDEFAEEPIMLINQHIGDLDGMGVGIIGSQFESELLALDSGKYGDKKRIKVFINSVGGSVMEGMSIYNAILRSECKVDTYCTGVAASIAAVIFQAGKRRYIADYGRLMIHNPGGADAGSDEYNAMKTALVTMMQTRNSKNATDENISQMMNRTTWMKAQECIDKGFADCMEPSATLNKRRMEQATDVTAMWQVGNEILNSAITPKFIKMSKVTNFLKLNDDANEESILTAITDMHTKLSEKETALTTAQNTLTEKERLLTEATNKVTELETEVTNFKNAATAAEDLQKTQEATAEIGKFVNLGKIKNDATVIAKWVNSYKTDPSGVKEMLEALPAYKKAPVTFGKETLPTEVTNHYSMAAQMGQIASKK